MATTSPTTRNRAPQADIIHIVKPHAHAGLVQWLLWQRQRRQTSPAGARHRRLGAGLGADQPLSWPVARFLAWQEEWGIRHADGITAASRWLEARAQPIRQKRQALSTQRRRGAGHGDADPAAACRHNVLFLPACGSRPRLAGCLLAGSAGADAGLRACWWPASPFSRAGHALRVALAKSRPTVSSGWAT